MDNCNNNQRIPYMGGDYVKCPRCSNMVNSRYCPFCNLDLSTVYSKPAPIMKSEPIIAQYVYRVQNTQQPIPPQQPPFNPQQPPFNPQNPYNAYNQQPPYYKPRRKNTWLIPVAIVLAVLFVAIASVFLRNFLYNGVIKDIIGNQQIEQMPAPFKQDDFVFSGGISADEFKKLKVGMTYAEVSSIVGGDGEIVNSGKTLKKETFYVYCWYGENNPNAIVYVTVTTDKVSDITVEGTL